MEPDLGIVIPAHNEETNLLPLYEELTRVLDPTAYQFELLIIDDGSSDATTQIIRSLAKRDRRVKGLILTRSFGHQAAISIGLQIVCGHYVGIMDADLQDQPTDLLRLFHSLREESADVAYAVRRTRAEPVIKRAAYRLFYRILGKLANVSIPLDSGDFCVMNRKAVDQLTSLPERLRFVRGLRAWIGGKQIGVEVDRAARHSGAPSYTVTKLIRLAADGLVSFSDVPLRLASVLGFAVSGLAGVGMVVVLVWRFTGKLPSGAGLATIALSILFLGGVQLVTVGIVGEYVGRIFEEVKARPVALIGERVGFEGNESVKGE
jgi:dolichol-phosphate mannosyltransferase